MAKSATDTIHDVINAAVVDAIVALKDASKGLPNALLRDLNAIHANTAFADLPEPVQRAVATSVRNAFAELRRGGFVVAEAGSVSPAGRPSGGPGAPSSPPGRGRGGPPPGRRPSPRR